MFRDVPECSVFLVLSTASTGLQNKPKKYRNFNCVAKIIIKRRLQNVNLLRNYKSDSITSSYKS